MLPKWGPKAFRRLAFKPFHRPSSLLELHVALHLVQFRALRAEGVDFGAPGDDVEDAPRALLHPKTIEENRGKRLILRRNLDENSRNAEKFY